MLVRLAFAIATAVDPELLLIDEVLAAGDMAFIKKARRRMRELMDRARAIVREKKAVLERLKRGSLPQQLESARQDRDKALAPLN